MAIEYGRKHGQCRHREGLFRLRRQSNQAIPLLPAFTGVAMSAETQRKNRLYVADFHNRTIRVFDDRWTDITQSVPFELPANLPSNLSPYNIQQLAGRLYVTFASVDLTGEEPGADVPGPGNGRLAEYDLDGRLLRVFVDAGRLNSPWGLAIAPPAFGPLAGSLLVANFGDGTIAAFDLWIGAFRDVLRDGSGTPLEIDGIWGLAFGNGVSLGDADSLYYTAGPNGEQDGVFGRLRYSDSKPGPPSRAGVAPVPESATLSLLGIGLAGAAVRRFGKRT